MSHQSQPIPCRVVDIAASPRHSHFAYFRSLPYPYTGVTVNVDVTALADFCRRTPCSFYLAFIHAAALAADRIPELRRRIRGDQVVEYAECPTSHTEAAEDGTYTYCTLRHHMPLADYLRTAGEAREAARHQRGLVEDEDVESMYFVSTLPWLHYTALVQPVACGDESNPRITWGRYEEDAAGRLMMPVSLLVHHALADGVHMAAFYEGLTGFVQHPETMQG